MIPGTNIKIGEKTFLVPPLNFAAMKKHRDFLQKAMSGEFDARKIGPEDIEAMFDMIYLAVKRNYPDVTEEQFAQDLDLAAVQTIFPALLKTSGFEAKEAAPGE
jgi:hypothetical protein